MSKSSKEVDIDWDKPINLFTVSEVADILKVKKSYIYELIYTSELKAVRLSQRRIRITTESLISFISEKNGNNINTSTSPHKGGR